MRQEHLRDRMTRVIRAVLLTNIVLTAALAAIATSGGIRWSEAPGAEAVTQDGFSENGGALSPVSSAEATRITTGKAIFRTGRVTKTKKMDELAHFQFRGASCRNGTWSAFIKDTKLKKLRIKRVGDALGSYEIADISKDCITVKRGSEPPIEIAKGY